MELMLSSESVDCVLYRRNECDMYGNNLMHLCRVNTSALCHERVYPIPMSKYGFSIMEVGLATINVIVRTRHFALDQKSL